MDEAAEADRYCLQNVEQPVRVLEDDLVTLSRVVEVRRHEAVGLVPIRGRLHELVD